MSPITGLSPALTAILALTLLDEQVGAFGLVGIAVATGAVVLLASKPDREDGSESWVWLAILSFALQGVGAFIAKVVVTPSGPAALLVTSAAVQLGVGATWLRRSGQAFPHLGSRLMRWTVVVLVLAALATIGNLFALSLGPATIIVPLVATSPALGGLAGARPQGTLDPAPTRGDRTRCDRGRLARDRWVACRLGSLRCPDDSSGATCRSNQGLMSVCPLDPIARPRGRTCSSRAGPA